MARDRMPCGVGIAVVARQKRRGIVVHRLRERQSDDFIDAFLKADGSWVEAYEAPRESGVAVDMDMPQIDADEFNAEARESFRSAWIAASGSHSPAGKAPVSYEAFSGAMHECNKLKEEVERLRVKPTDANVPVLIEALYRCGCPVAINTTVGECAERGCGCSINAERLKGCMEGGHTTSLPSTEGSST
jgi:hypothetical protein